MPSRAIGAGERAPGMLWSMAIDPPFRDVASSPISAAVAIAAIGVSVWWWTGADIGPFLPSAQSPLTRPWSLALSVFPHVNAIHLAFNLYWWLVFGAVIERAWGSLKLLAAAALFAVVSGASEVMVSGGGIGLSGVVYGLWAMLAIAGRRDGPFRGVITPRINGVFTVWFFVCIGLTLTDVLPVANVAHATGAIAGALLGMCVAAEKRRRSAWVVGLVSVSLCAYGAALVPSLLVRLGVHPYMSASSAALLGHSALIEGRFVEAVPLLEEAAAEDPLNPELLMNLGIAYQSVQRHQEAKELYFRAVELKPELREYLATAIASILDHEAAMAAQQRRYSEARALAKESLSWNPEGAYAPQLMDHINSAEFESPLWEVTEDRNGGK